VDFWWVPAAGWELPLLPVGDALGELSRLDGGVLLEAALDTTPPYVRTEVARHGRRLRFLRPAFALDPLAFRRVAASTYVDMLGPI